MLRYLGFDPVADAKYMPIIQKMMNKPPPRDWKVYKDDDGLPYFHNALTGETTREHFMDVETKRRLNAAKAAG